jgi:ABC-type sugar transport system ATPase subunit
LRKKHYLEDDCWLEEITSGNIWIGDKLVNDVPPKDRDIAMVFKIMPFILI